MCTVRRRDPSLRAERFKSYFCIKSSDEQDVISTAARMLQKSVQELFKEQFKLLIGRFDISPFVQTAARTAR